MTRSLAFALLALFATSAAAGVKGSKHDMSASGPGAYRAESETSPCIFCHISHRAGQTHLSNRPDVGMHHRPYESSTLKTRPGAPSGSSRICLSCHDGTVAVGQTRNKRIKMAGGDRPIGPERRSHLGTDLRRSHPVSMKSPATGAVHPPRPGDAVRLDGSAMVQCVSCHDPHDEWRDPVVGKFLVKPSARSAICLSCHAETGGAASSTHLTSGATYVDAATGRKETVAEAGCGICHVPHGAEPRGRLLRAAASDDETCLRCHESSTDRSISADLRKASAHSSPGKGPHDAAEGPHGSGSQRLPEIAPGAARHVTCVDCHDPHASTPRPAVAPGAAGALAGVWGIDLDGQRVAEARFEYEVCLKCHGDSANKPQDVPAGGRRVRRSDSDANLRLVFSPSAASFHPVAAPGKNPSVPSLTAGLSPASLILCTDCHASDSSPGAGGTGARGPHGSTYAPILERQYLTADLTPESAASYALCYKCHDRDVLLSDRSSFPLHRKHVVERSAPCSACHDAHGVSREAGNERNNAHLVSFDLTIVRPGRGGLPRYETAGASHGTCALSCHGVDHGPGSKAFSY